MNVKARWLAAALGAGIALGSSGDGWGAGFQVRENSASALGNAFAGAAASTEDLSIIANNPAVLQETNNPLSPAAVATALGAAVENGSGQPTVDLIGAVSVGVFAFIYFAMMNSMVPGLIFLAIVLSFIPHDMMYGPQAALIAECFTPRLRYSGSSLGFHLSSVVAGGPAPLIATALFAATGSGYAVALYILFCAIVSITATSFLPDYTNQDISQEHEIRSAASTAA